MSNSTNNTPRIVRGKPPKRKFTDNTYRKAKPYLLRDFGRRCAYSQQHADRSLGVKSMEVDHFNPKLTGADRNNYKNLFLATRHCNGSKSDIWPTKNERKKGLFLINPSKQMDYGVNIFEHPVTHRLIGVTHAGDFHITACDLNAPHFIDERRQRSRIHELLEERPVGIKESFIQLEQIGKPPGSTVESPLLKGMGLLKAYADSLREQLSLMIPMIPYLAKEHPKYAEEIELMKALFST